MLIDHEINIFMVLVAIIPNISMQISTKCSNLKRLTILLAFLQLLAAEQCYMCVPRPFKGRASPPSEVPSSGVSHHLEVLYPRLLLMSYKCSLLPIAVWSVAVSPFQILSYPTYTYSVNL